MRRISLSLAIAACALLALGAFQMTANAAGPSLGNQKITLAPGQRIAIPIRFWSLVYGKPSSGQFQGPQARASDAVVKTVLSALLDGNAVSHPNQTQLAVWYAVDNTWHNDAQTNMMIAQQIISDSTEIVLPTPSNNSPTLDMLVAQGKLTASFVRTRPPLPQSDNIDSPSVAVTPNAKPTSDQATPTVRSANGQGNLLIQNKSNQPITFLWLQGLTLVSSDLSNNQVLVLARDIPSSVPGSVTPTATQTSDATQTRVPTSSPGSATQTSIALGNPQQQQGTNTPTHTPTITRTATPTVVSTGTTIPTVTAAATQAATATITITATVAATTSATGTAVATPTATETLPPVATDTPEQTAVGASSTLPTTGGDAFLQNFSALGYILAGFLLLLTSGALELYRTMNRGR